MKKVNILSTIHFIASFLGFFFWLLNIQLYHFLGSCSLVYSFVFAVADESMAVAFFSLIWLFIMIISLIVTFIIALKKQFFVPFLITVGADLCFSIGVLLYSMSFIIFLGLFYRGLYYAVLIRCVKVAEREKNSFSFSTDTACASNEGEQ